MDLYCSVTPGAAELLLVGYDAGPAEHGQPVKNLMEEREASCKMGTCIKRVKEGGSRNFDDICCRPYSTANVASVVILEV